MDAAGTNALLPAGLRDVLAPDAAHEAAALAQLVEVFSMYGYQRVEPPLVEFETTLLNEGGHALTEHMFRVMDPVSQRMMAVRADMTLQVARIASTRLANEPRPLRLSYGGQVLRVRGSQLRPERQFTEAGIELIGADAASADAEAIVLAAEALHAVGVKGCTIDLNSPAIAGAVTSALNLPEQTMPALRAALDHKDSTAVARLTDDDPTLGTLVRTTGPAAEVLEQLAKLELPPAARGEVLRLTEVVGLVRAAKPDLELTADPVEYRGFEYHSGVSFTLLARGVRGDIGRGGRYLSQAGEPATGFTLFLDSVMRAVPQAGTKARVFVPFGSDVGDGASLRRGGFVTIAGLAEVADVRAEAQRLGCSHAYIKGAVVELEHSKDG